MTKRAIVLVYLAVFGLGFWHAAAQSLIDAAELDIRYSEMEVDANGNIYTFGPISISIHDAAPGPVNQALPLFGSQDCGITKLDSNLNVIWAHSWGSTKQEECFDLALDNNGNVFVAGRFKDSLDIDPGPDTTMIVSNGNDDLFVAKFDSAGGFQWCVAVGGSGKDEAKAVATDNSGNVYVTGQYSQGADFDPSSSTATIAPNTYGGLFVARYSASGQLNWVGGAQSGYDAQGRTIQCDGTNSIYVGGHFSGSGVDFDFGASTSTLSSMAQQDAFLAKYSLSGNLQWAHAIHGDGAESIDESALDASGNLYIAGHVQTLSDSIHIDIDPGTGTTYITRHYGLAGWISKFSAGGVFNWGFTFEGPETEGISDLEIDANNNLIVAGHFSEYFDADPSSGTYWLKKQPTVVFTGMLLSYNSGGNLNWAIKHGLSGYSSYNWFFDVALDHNNNLLTHGRYTDSTDLDPAPGVHLLQNSYGEYFLARYNTAPVELCPGPDQLWTTNQQDTAVWFNWNTLANASAYKIRYVEAGSGGSPTALQKNWNHGIRKADGLLPGTTYNWSVQSNCEGNWGGFSPVSSFTTLASPCAEPHTLTTSPIGVNQARINWTGAIAGTEHRIQYRSAGASAWQTIDKDGSWQHHWLTGLTAGTNYEWRIKSKCLPGNASVTAWSAIQSFTTATSNKQDVAGGASMHSNYVVWPNPASGTLNVHGPDNSNATLQLIDITGNVVLSSTCNAQQCSLDVAHLSRGVYVLWVASSNRLTQHKIVLH